MNARAARTAAAERIRRAYDTELGSVRAFLPERVPIDVLPPLLQPYLNATGELTLRYPVGGGVRGWLDGLFGRRAPDVVALLPALSEPERQRLMTVLSVLAHAYRWDSVPPAQDRFAERRIQLPAGLREPWQALAELQESPCVGTTWSMHLCNWRMTDRPGGSSYRPEELTPQNVRVAHQWLLPPYDAHLERFSLTFVLMEAAGAGALLALVEATEACANNDPDDALQALGRLHAGIRAVAASFTANVRAAHIAPEVWLELVQPTFAWAAETVDGPLEGPSGMQLGTIQSLDAALGVSGGSDLAEQTRHARRYLPAAHHRFLHTLERAGPLIPTYVAASGEPDLRDRFNACLKALGTFRVAHAVRGARYLSAGRHGESSRVSTGLGTAWRPDQPAAPSSPGHDDDPVDIFRRAMAERIDETHGAALG